jgi:polyisoprenoid-binding protein YceI
MNTFKKISALTLMLLFAAGQVYAAAAQWKIDPTHSGIYFSVKHIVSNTHGFFEDFKGTTHFDPDNLDASSFDFTVAVKSVNTNNRKRDGHLRSDDFFSAKKYPEMTFKSTRITHKHGNQYVVEGQMTVRDVTKSVAIPFTFFGIQDNPFNPKEAVAGFEARFTIDRLAYGVGNGKFLKMGVVGKDVDVVISTEMTRKK